MQALKRPWLLLKAWGRRFFSPRVEDSLRLRLIGLSSLWLGAWGLTWVGGDMWLSLGGGLLGTLGHLVSWYWRHRTSGIRPVLIALAVVGLAIFMRFELLEVFSGDWLPVGYFLVMVSALASFDVRTRGGLYTSIGLSGIVLFFASQQAFDPSFMVFVIGFVVLILAFLSVTFLEDGIRNAKIHWGNHRPAVLIYWIVITCVVFVFSGFAFWLMPRGEDSLIRPPQVAILPFTGATLAEDARPPPTIEPSEAQPAGGQSVEAAGGQPVAVELSLETLEIGDGRNFGRNRAVLFVRSKVASYWRGQTLEKFDGQFWQSDLVPEYLKHSAGGLTFLYSRESFGRSNRVWYPQTFYVQQDHPNSLFQGYRGLRIVANEGSLEGLGVKRGESYRVISAQPRYTPERLRRDYTSSRNPRFTEIPPGTGRLRSLAKRITEGASNDFEKAERITSYLVQEGNFDPNRPGDLKSSATMNEFLFQNKPGSALDYASATVMLARAAGLPARMAVGYLPGVRDPLSGAYLVRESDAHAWAEIFFTRHGWVPFDSAPREDIVLPGDSNSRLHRVFQSGVGEKIYGAVKAAPSQLAGPSLQFLQNPLIAIIGPILLLTGLVLRWLYTRSKESRVLESNRGLAYTRLAGNHRRELLKIYYQVEKLLRRKTGTRRQPWQTVEDYSRLRTGGSEEIQRHLSWFVRAVWHAAYDPEEPPDGMVREARSRLTQLRTQAEW